MTVTRIESEITHLDAEVALYTILDRKSRLQDILVKTTEEFPCTFAASRAHAVLMEGGGLAAVCVGKQGSFTIFCPDPREWTSVFIHELWHAVANICEYYGIPANTEAAACIMGCVHHDLWKPLAKTMCVKSEKPKRRSKCLKKR